MRKKEAKSERKQQGAHIQNIKNAQPNMKIGLRDDFLKSLLASKLVAARCESERDREVWYWKSTQIVLVSKLFGCCFTF